MHFVVESSIHAAWFELPPVQMLSDNRAILASAMRLLEAYTCIDKAPAASTKTTASCVCHQGLLCVPGFIS